MCDDGTPSLACFLFGVRSAQPRLHRIRFQDKKIAVALNLWKIAETSAKIRQIGGVV